MKKQEQLLIVIANSYFLCENNSVVCAIAQAESPRCKLRGDLAVRKACHGVPRGSSGPKAARSWRLGNSVKIVDETLLTIC